MDRVCMVTKDPKNIDKIESENLTWLILLASMIADKRKGSDHTEKILNCISPELELLAEKAGVYKLAPSYKKTRQKMFDDTFDSAW